MTTKTPVSTNVVPERVPMGMADYIPYLISMIGVPPYLFEGMTSFSLFLEADPGLRIGEHNVVDKYLNRPLGCSQNECVYRRANTNPYLVLSDIPKSVSTTGDQSHSIAYQEVALIIPVIVQDLKVAGYFLPILFVDGPPGGGDQLQGAVPIVIGREMYGLPKVPAKIELGYQGRNLNSATVSLFGDEIIKVTALSAHKGPEVDHFTDKQRLHFAEKAFGPIKPNANYTSGTTSDGHVVDLKHIGHGNPLIGLRQMRNARDLKLSGHQDIVESPYAMDPMQMPSPLGNGVQIEFDLSSGFFSELHLQEKYVLQYLTDGAVYQEIDATFGDPEQTTVRHAPD